MHNYFECVILAFYFFKKTFYIFDHLIRKTDMPFFCSRLVVLNPFVPVVEFLTVSVFFQDYQTKNICVLYSLCNQYLLLQSGLKNLLKRIKRLTML